MKKNKRLRHSNKTLLASVGCSAPLRRWPASTIDISPVSAALQRNASLDLGPTRWFLLECLNQKSRPLATRYYNQERRRMT